MGKKLKIGWFSFSCCEDSTIILTEMLNDHFDDWVKVVDFRHIRVLKKNNSLNDLDVAFIEGAIASNRDAEKVKEIRKNAKRVVAIGSCAINGMPSAQRNAFDKGKRKEIEFLIKKFSLAKNVRTLSQVIKVDDQVPGCPMTEDGFLKVLNKYFKEFGIA